MREPYTRLYVHTVWATWDRAPLLTPEIFRVVDGCVRHECAQMRVEVIAFGVVADHVHLLVRIPTTITVAGLVKQVKGSSSHLVEERLRTTFKWQGGYGASTIDKSDVPRVRDYVLRQEEHHRDHTTDTDSELPPAPSPR
ncbi:MAG TPA: IS200/IS605 family transposase [Longimicrobium sp.]|jgi:REP element-mobilizing transposase RayT